MHFTGTKYFALKFAVVEAPKMLSSHGGFLTIAMYQTQVDVCVGSVGKYITKGSRKKHCLETVSKISLEGLKVFNGTTDPTLILFSYFMKILRHISHIDPIHIPYEDLKTHTRR